MNNILRKGRPMRMRIAAALVAAAVAFAAPVSAPVSAYAGSLTEGTPVIQTGGGHHGGWQRRDGYRDGRRYHRRDHRGYYRHRRDYGYHAPPRRHRGHGHDHDVGPYVLGGVVLGTFLFLHSQEHY